jgi:mono/diheme cytochrome c family protein
MKLKVIGAISAVIIFITACQNEKSIEFRRYYSSGALLYQSHCQNCHGDNGEGLSALIPPLTDSNYLIKNKAELACSIKSGLKGPVVIKTKAFDDAMPANDLSPIEIAQVLTYVGNSFGNKLNTINEQEVQTDLAKCK